MIYSLHISVAGWLFFPLPQYLEAAGLCSCSEQALNAWFHQQAPPVIPPTKDAKGTITVSLASGRCERCWKPCCTSSSLWSAMTNVSIPLFEHFLQAGIAFYGTPLQLHEGSFPMSNSFVPQISAAEILTDTVETCFFIFIIQIWGQKSKGLNCCWVWTVLNEYEELQPQIPKVH